MKESHGKKKPAPRYQDPHGDTSGGCGEAGACTPRSNSTTKKPDANHRPDKRY